MTVATFISRPVTTGPILDGADGKHERRFALGSDADARIYQWAAHESVRGGVYASQSLTYDSDGNLLSDGEWTYSWDDENRLIAMESVTTLAEEGRRKLAFSYDPQGCRIGRKVYLWDAGTSAYATMPSSSLTFVYDGWNVVAERDALNANEVVRTYVWGPDLSGTLEGAGGTDGLLAVTQASGAQAGTYFTGYDANGNVTSFVKSNGDIAATYEYGPFGEPLRSSGAMAGINPVKWSSKYVDNETQLAYYGYRYCNPQIGSPCCWKGGESISGYWMKDLESFGFARSFPVYGVWPVKP